jgi:hypothetical protein
MSQQIKLNMYTNKIMNEEVKDEMLFISYLKLWSRNNFEFTLLSTAENPHNNESIKNYWSTRFDFIDGL